MTDNQLKWSGRTRGGYWGNWFFAAVHRVFGLRATFVPLAPIAAYYLLASRESVRSAGEYFGQLYGPLPAGRRLWYVYKNFYSLGQMLMERLAIVQDRRGRFPPVLDGAEHLRAALAMGRGVIILGAHIGNWEAAGHMLRDYQVPVNLVGFDREQPHIRRLFEAQMRTRSFRFIAVDAEGQTSSIAVLAALRRGELVALHGDRVFGGETATIPFMGRPAKFPVGAYQLAAISGAPLVMAFAVRERVGRYRLIAHPALTPPPHASPDERQAFQQAALQLYAERLEALARRYSFQWYNFYPFWG